MKNIHKITILGCAGSGKSTLGLKLQEKLNLPLYHLDQYYWLPNWGRREFKDFKKLHHELCDQQEWIIEGLYSKVLDYRLEKTEIIIFLDLPRYICMWRVMKRTLVNYGQKFFSSANGCYERLDWEFIKWVWNFKYRSRKNIISLVKQYSKDKTVHVIRSPKELQAFYQNVLD